VRLPPVSLDHLSALCDDTGLIEHAWLAVPRRESGYTADDNGRLLVVLARADPDRLSEESRGQVLRLCRLGLGYLQHAALRRETGFHNRLSFERRWLDQRGSDDSIGRALWGLGTLAARTGEAHLREAAHALFFQHYRLASPYSRAIIYATLGGLEMAELDGSAELRRQLRSWAGQLPQRSGVWRWPEPRLVYDNARLPEALMGVGATLSDDRLVQTGLGLLEWLVETETAPGGSHFSFTPVAGRDPSHLGPGFDQQPIEAWAMIDACVLAGRLAGAAWQEPAIMATEWFLGRNDVGAMMVDPATGAGFDGLTPTGPNRNRGAESTLAAVAAMSHAWINSPDRS
jgi:hypothetical protein